MRIKKITTYIARTVKNESLLLDKKLTKQLLQLLKES
jgi:hypothetical protein